MSSAHSTSWRGLVSLTLFISGLLTALTGIILYIVPEGRVAFWVIWELLGLSKPQWQAIHTLSSFLFVIFAFLHLLNNWRSIANYVVRKSGGLNQIGQMLLALALAIIIVVSAVFSLPPLRWVTDFGAWAKAAWIAAPEYEPPFGHAEELSLKAFCLRMDIDLPAAEKALQEAGLKVDDPRSKIMKIASDNRVTPMQVYMAIKSLEQKPDLEAVTRLTEEEIDAKFAGTGIGRKNLAQICEQIGMDQDRARAILTRKGMEIGAVETMREAADRLPGIDDGMDIVKILLLEKD